MNDRPHSAGLGGDGDEVAAIAEVERRFGVTLDDGQAAGWITAGDVFASLRERVPVEAGMERDMWRRFAEALTWETGVDPASIEPDSPLLQPPLRGRGRRVLALLALFVR